MGRYEQAHGQVLLFGGTNKFLGERFLFLLYVYNKLQYDKC